jgi:hypothetical protein
MIALLIFLAVILIGLILGGLVGIGLGKFPAQSRIGNVLRGALFGIGASVAFLLFALMVIRVFLGEMGGSDVSYRS